MKSFLTGCIWLGAVLTVTLVVLPSHEACCLLGLVGMFTVPFVRLLRSWHTYAG